MIKGIDFTGITVSFYCHDGKGEYLLHKRTTKCRDEHGAWDCGGGGLTFGETLEDGLKREIQEEYGTKPKEIQFLGFDEVFREHEDKPTHWISFRYRVLLDREKVVNGEPEKIEELSWHKISDFPIPLHSQMKSALEKYSSFLV